MLTQATTVSPSYRERGVCARSRRLFRTRGHRVPSVLDALGAFLGPLRVLPLIPQLSRELGHLLLVPPCRPAVQLRFSGTISDTHPGGQLGRFRPGSRARGGARRSQGASSSARPKVSKEGGWDVAAGCGLCGGAVMQRSTMEQPAAGWMGGICTPLPSAAILAQGGGRRLACFPRPPGPRIGGPDPSGQATSGPRRVPAPRLLLSPRERGSESGFV